MEELAREMMRKITEALNAMWAGMPIGWYLCVHEPLINTSNFGPISTLFKYMGHQEYHTSPSWNACKAEGQKTTHGPKESNVTDGLNRNESQKIVIDPSLTEEQKAHVRQEFIEKGYLNPVLANRYPSNFDVKLFEAQQEAFAKGYDKALNIRSGRDYQRLAKDVVASYIAENLEITDETPDFEIYVVWFTFILGNWKALVSTSLPDGMYYEVTYNACKGETYLDAYKKFKNICIKD